MQKTDNRSMGNRFEQELSHALADRHFWVHVMQQNKAGQPADIIAVKGKYHTLIDCKVCENGDFPFSRIEENQRYAMRMFTRRCGELCYFALKTDINGTDEIRMISLSRIETLEARGRKQLSKRDMELQTWSLEKWLESSNFWAEDV